MLASKSGPTYHIMDPTVALSCDGGWNVRAVVATCGGVVAICALGYLGLSNAPITKAFIVTGKPTPSTYHRGAFDTSTPCHQGL